MQFTLFGDLFGGIGLFLLGMHLMTQGLRKAAGPSLKQILRTGTRSRLRGLVSGTLITAMVQSSSVVTIATIGFVNAGLLTLAQSVSVIYGCNIGTTMVGWLIALIGFKIKISALALPLIGGGMLLRLAGRGGRLTHIGLALAGFGVFFIGLDFLKGAFAGFEQHMDLSSLGSSGLSLMLFVVTGFVLTLLMQSSAAALAVTLSLTASGSIPLAAAAAMVIGANVGTTSTAILAVIGATSNAKRIAAAHVLFNLLTGLVGLILLLLLAPWLNSIDAARFDLVLLLALFHSIFNLTGVALLWPLTDRLVAILERRFCTQEEDEGRTRYLDDTLVQMPSLAIEAMAKEMTRLDQICSRMAREAINSSDGYNNNRLRAQQQGVDQLVGKIGAFCQRIAENDISAEVSGILPTALRVVRYLNEISRLSCLLPGYYDRFDVIADEATRRDVHDYQKASIKLIDACEIDDSVDRGADSAHLLLHQLERQYQSLKSSILLATTERRLSPEDTVQLLDALSHIHRLAEQAEKVSRYWSGITPLQHRDAAHIATA
ncbi:Na/Pi cotransporter family protein [Marinobacterium sedimentorum]|uniref:Na/Pi cotransporter family protein n=1 Tax=Marinobacterium sedimentorum TaxID=2927804 RepID=UPI0020C7405D|nr:Na/Pi symporter [Marinobacterium sedimentorum]MCP8689095.1 Na/Pi symporter [Marinobacterium sedimentorum]